MAMSKQTKFRVYQIVGGGDYGRRISFENLVKKTRYNFHWHEENCHLMGLWLEDPKAHITLFTTGKFIINGVKSMKNAREAIRAMQNDASDTA